MLRRWILQLQYVIIKLQGFKLTNCDEVVAISDCINKLKHVIKLIERAQGFTRSSLRQLRRLLGE